MMRWLIACLVLWPTAAVADDGDVSGGATGDGLFVAGAEHGVANAPRSGGRSTNQATGPQILLGAAGCDGADQAQGDVVVTFCPAPEGQARPVLTLGLIRSAFAELRLPAGDLVIQPPDGTTLVNFDTNFYTPATAPLTRTVTLLGQRVTLEATPSRYRWEFGDGKARTTTEPGSPYPRLEVTHSYLRTGTYRPRLATTYTGRYRVAGRGWRPIPGTVTIQGAAQSLRAIEARPTLVPYE